MSVRQLSFVLFSCISFLTRETVGFASYLSPKSRLFEDLVKVTCRLILGLGDCKYLVLNCLFLSDAYFVIIDL